MQYAYNKINIEYEKEHRYELLEAKLKTFFEDAQEMEYFNQIVKYNPGVESVKNVNKEIDEIIETLTEIKRLTNMKGDNQ